MITKGVLARMEAKPDKVNDVAEFLKSAQSLVENEPDTVSWFAVQLGPTTFGIFDVFPDESYRVDTSLWIFQPSKAALKFFKPIERVVMPGCRPLS